jgi:hypothetical protein
MVQKYFLRIEIDFAIRCARFGGYIENLESEEVIKNTECFNLSENQDHLPA